MRQLTYIGIFLALNVMFNTKLSAQHCNISISGSIIDQGSEVPLEFANIYVKETQAGAVSDEKGHFNIPKLCAGAYHLQISHINCTAKTIYLEISKDTSIRVVMVHHAELLNEVVIHDKRTSSGGQISQSIDQSEISREGSKSLSGILEKISGVSSLKGGSGIAKPVIHGLYGNRVAILNNGIAQAGQQWGNDHAPEIDPFVANHIAVVKGANTLAYGTNAIGGLIMIEPGNIPLDPHIHGHVNYIFNSNGHGHTFNTQLEQGGKKIAWRWTGTYKRRGDAKTPNYYLTNTGKKEWNTALQLEKKFNMHWSSHFYYSLFYSEIGILRGSHIGNLTDLEEALKRDVPFFTKDSFSYHIEAPRQKVFHHLVKFENKYFFDEGKVLTVTYGGQWDNRNEYDVRRGGRSDIPALSLNQFSHAFEAKYSHSFDNDLLLNGGIQMHIVDNANNPSTGILPLIPNYISYNPSGFLIFQKDNDGVSWEVGGRYDYKNLDVTAISISLPHVLEYFKHHFHNYAFSGGLNYDKIDNWKFAVNSGYMLRAPEINELYSYGLHQGVSGIEEGRRDLQQERSFKTSLSAHGKIKNKLFVQSVLYYHHINDYIYLQPQSEYRLTIRGAFPLFIYQQTDALLYGSDLQLQYEFNRHLKLSAQYAIVRGQDRKYNIPLINIPADNASAELKYNFNDGENRSESFINVAGRYVSQQSRLLESQDFLAPPKSYFLAKIQAGSRFKLGENHINIELEVDNLFNTIYRDYLNRMRYFSDEQGRDFLLKIRYEMD